jgi:hypothetical protein
VLANNLGRDGQPKPGAWNVVLSGSAANKWLE